MNMHYYCMRFICLIYIFIVRIPVNMHYFQFLWMFSGGAAAAAEAEEPDQPTWWGNVAELPSFDDVHSLIYDKLSRTELKGMKLTAKGKGKGKTTRSANKVSLQLNLYLSLQLNLNHIN